MRKLLRAEGQPETVEVSILLVDDPQIQEMNRQYRDSDRPTDVLAFSQREGEGPEGMEEDDVLGCGRLRRYCRKAGRGTR